MINVLIDHGADINMPSVGVMHVAVLKHCLWLDRLAEPWELTLQARDGLAPLWVAVDHGRMEAVETLVHRGANMNLKVRTSLHS